MILRAVADLVMPRICLCCGRELDSGEEHLCADCLKDLPLTRYWKLRSNPMAEHFNDLIQRQMGDDTSYVPYGYAAALFFYKSGYRSLTKALKYKRNFAAGVYFARMLGRALAESDLFKSVDLVVPVPLHWTRRWRRGYNQAEIIAREVARELGVQCDSGMLRRVRRTRTQTKLDIEGRAHNVGGAFRLQRGTTLNDSLHHILLIDDVFTTGATAAACETGIHNACSAQARSSVRVSVATLACV